MKATFIKYENHYKDKITGEEVFPTSEEKLLYAIYKEQGLPFTIQRTEVVVQETKFKATKRDMAFITDYMLKDYADKLVIEA